MVDNIKLFGPLNSGAAAGGAGVATSTGVSTIPINGAIYGVYVKYNGSPPAGTTDVTISTVGTLPRSPSLAILTITDAATSGYFWPRVEMQTNAGAGVAAYDVSVIADTVQVTIAQANNDDSIDVWFLMV